MCPMMYGTQPGVLQTTNGTPNTENDSLFIKPGSARGVVLMGFQLLGRAAGATSLSGIVARIKKWTSTSSSGGTGITPSPRDPGMQAAKHTAGYAVAGVTSGTGGPTLQGGAGCGVSGPGGWSALNPDDGITLEAGANMSIDAFVAAGTASLNYEFPTVSVAE